MSINLTDELIAKTKKGKIASAKQVFLEGDQENLQQIGDKTHQLEDAIKDITATGGASTANAVSYNNENSGMSAITAQGAIDELATKNKSQDTTIAAKAEKSEVQSSVSELKAKNTSQDAEIAKKANISDVTSQMQTEQTRVNAELDKKFNKENIAQNLGESKDKVVSQFALPFREIESPEFIKAIVDAEDHFLFGIQLDGSIEWGKGIPAPIRAKLQEIINQCQQDKTDILEAFNSSNTKLSNELSDVRKYINVNLYGKKISILGDSLSTFKDNIPSGNVTYYPNDNNDVTLVEQTWWMSLIHNSNAKLEINNSFSGSKVSGSEGSSYTKRVENLGNPDYIIIHGGTNDIWQNVPVGTLHFDLSKDDLNKNEFADSYDLMIRKCRELYPHANIILVIPHNVSVEYTSIIEEISVHYNLFGLVDLHESSFVLVKEHYQIIDMLTVSNAVSKVLYNNKNVLREEGKSLIEDEVKECFRVIENEEFLKAIVDSDDKVLFGLYRATGKPYYPLNEMYHVIQNEEYFAAWIDTDDKVVLGIRRDGEIIGEIHAVNALKQVISQLQSDLVSLQEKVGAIYTNIKELLDVFSLQESSEYLAVEKDADGKVLSATNSDGSHYIHNVKSETIPTEFGHIEDQEGRMEIATDAEGKVMSYRDSSGKKHEHDMEVTNLDVSNLNLQGNSVNDIGDALKANDFKLDTPSDFSKDSYIELPIPRIAAQVRIYASKLPTTKQDDIEAEIEYNDKDGNYFRKPVILNAQGSSSMSFPVKNMAIDINDESKIKFGNFPTQDSFHLKKYYIDVFRGQCIVAYWLMEQVYQTRPVGKRYPYEILSDEYSPYTGKSKVEDDFYTGAKCHPDGFPINITWVNSVTNEEKDMGIYAWNLKKSKEIYHANKKNTKHIILDGVIDNVTLFGGNVDWTQFEIRNPKSLVDANGNKYDGDNPKELSDTDNNSKKVKDSIVRLSGVKEALNINNTKETFEKYFIVDAFIDYFIISQVLYHYDGFRKNWIWCTWDGEHWTPTLYDTDSIFGGYSNGTYIIPNSDKQGILGTENILGLETLYAEEIKARYKNLRDKGIFSTDNIINLLKKWLDKVGYANIEKEISIYNDIPSYRNPLINDGWENLGYYGSENNYSEEKIYHEGDICVYGHYGFKATKEVKNVPPLSGIYTNIPQYCGFYNSIKRVSVWLSNRIAFLDKEYEYNNL